MRSRVLGETDRAEALEIARLILRLVGAEPTTIDATVSSASATLAA